SLSPSSFPTRRSSDLVNLVEALIVRRRHELFLGHEQRDVGDAGLPFPAAVANQRRLHVDLEEVADDARAMPAPQRDERCPGLGRSEEHTSELQSLAYL